MVKDNNILVSVVVPVHNGSQFLDEAFDSILNQTWRKSLEVSIFDDCSSDDSYEKCLKWKTVFESHDINVTLGKNDSSRPGGVGLAKNKAISQSNGKFVCFLDIDDIMQEERIELQLCIALENPNCIVGSGYSRIPEGSTVRYTEWSNNLDDKQLYTQIYTSFGPTIINPTWFCPRDLFQTVGFFKEIQRGFPEDLEFFFRHLDNGGKLLRIHKPLLTYRYHSAGASFSVHENTIWDLRIHQIQKDVLSRWHSFTIWNAGKKGRKFYRSLDHENRKKVTAMCDVDEKKIAKGFYTCEVIKDESGLPPKIPIVHFKVASKPFIVCVKIGMTNGDLEDNLASLSLIEGVDYFHFN